MLYDTGMRTIILIAIIVTIAMLSGCGVRADWQRVKQDGRVLPA